jgi:hypothetical protein
MSDRLDEALRQIVRSTLASMVSEAVMLSPQQVAAKAALAKANPAAGGKAGVLFSRMLSKRITPEEADQMAGEVRALAAADARAVRTFDVALEDLQASQQAPSRIGDMISTTLKAASPAPGQSIAFKSVARRA